MLPDSSILIGQKLVENAKIQMRHFEEFSNNVDYFGDFSIFSNDNVKVELLGK